MGMRLPNTDAYTHSHADPDGGANPHADAVPEPTTVLPR